MESSNLDEILLEGRCIQNHLPKAKICSHKVALKNLFRN